jgi:hypothetical protein
MKKSLLLLLALTALALHGQTLTERILWADTSETYEIEKYNHSFSFDREGNYFFYVKKDGKSVAVANKAPIDNLCSAGGVYSKHGSSRYLRLCDQKEPDSCYVMYAMNEYGTNIYGPIAGKVQGYRSGGTRQHLAVTSLRGDTAFFYLDGQLVYSSPLETIKQFKLSDEEWVDFSDNGNMIYYLEKDNRFVLYVNGQPIDSSDFRFNAVSINDKGEYVYAKGFRPEVPVGKYDYMFFIHTQDTSFDYVRTTWESALMESGAYYFSGDDTGPDYIVLNGRLHKGIESIRHITLIDSKNAFYSFRQDKKRFLNVNGVIHPIDFGEIFCPTMDTNGHFAYFGLKNYYLYKVVDGHIDKEPLSKYGVRAMPLHITPQGSSLYYFKTDDSVFVYKDNALILKPNPNSEPFAIRQWKDVIPHLSVNKGPENGHSLLCLNYGEHSYFVHDGQLSEPLLPAFEQYTWEEPRLGGISEGLFNGHGYFAVQNIGEKEYQVVVNGRILGELHDVDRIFSEKGYFDGRQVVFYGRRNHSICQFILTL